MYVLKNFWFRSLMREFFFGLDRVIFNLISKIYDLIIVIAKTSPVSQADVAKFSQRIYGLLAIFMIFKVIFSLIMYVVNPDDFTEKSKGASKLLVNIVISLSLLILTPYIFSFAYDFQSKILDSNALVNLFFGTNENSGFFTSAGDDIAFVAFSPFVIPDVSENAIPSCSSLMIVSGGHTVMNPECTGLNNDEELTEKSSASTLLGLTDSYESKSEFTVKQLRNYTAGMNNRIFELAYRAGMITAAKEEGFIFEYHYFISTAVGILVALILISYCMDIATRSIKLAFLQLIAPIPIISYIDPKSGKDGLFKKWYKMSFSTFISLFVRLIVLYFCVFIISQINGRLVDITTGGYITSVWIYLLILIGALMFAKQFPKILENLGIKLDGGGKFTLNPLKKAQNDMLGGGALKKFEDKVGRKVVKAPINGLSTLGKKTIGGIDAARHGKGFKQGWDRTHGKLHNNFYKKLDEWAPDSAEERKQERQGKEEVKLMNAKWTKGKEAADKLSRYGKNIGADDTKPFDLLDGRNTDAYAQVYKNSEFIQSRMRLDKADAKRKVLDNISKSMMSGMGVKEAIAAQKSAIEKVEGPNGAFFQKFFAADGIYNKEANVATSEINRSLEDQTKAVSGMEKVHESIRKQYQSDARVEDELKFVKYNPTDPTNPDRTATYGNQNASPTVSTSSSRSNSSSDNSTQSEIIFTDGYVGGNPSVAEEERRAETHEQIQKEAEQATEQVNQEVEQANNLDVNTKVRIESLKQRLQEMILAKENARDQKDRDEIEHDIERIKAEIDALLR